MMQVTPEELLAFEARMAAIESVVIYSIEHLTRNEHPQALEALCKTVQAHQAAARARVPTETTERSAIACRYEHHVDQAMLRLFGHMTEVRLDRIRSKQKGKRR